MLILGVAYQHGHIVVSMSSLLYIPVEEGERTIELNSELYMPVRSGDNRSMDELNERI